MLTMRASLRSQYYHVSLMENSIFLMAHRAILIIAFHRVSHGYTYMYIYIYLREYALYM